MKTATQTATIAMGKMKNCRTRNGVVWRGNDSSCGASLVSATAGSGRTDAVAQAAQGLLDVDHQGLGRAVDLVEPAMELRVVGVLGLVGLGQVLEAGRPLHQALQAGLAVRVHVRGLCAPQVQAAQEGPDL